MKPKDTFKVSICHWEPTGEKILRLEPIFSSLADATRYACEQVKFLTEQGRVFEVRIIKISTIYSVYQSISCLGDSLGIAEKKARKFFPKYLFDLHKSMQVNNNHFCALLAADNINLENYLYEN